MADAVRDVRAVLVLALIFLFVALVVFGGFDSGEGAGSYPGPLLTWIGQLALVLALILTAGAFARLDGYGATVGHGARRGGPQE